MTSYSPEIFLEPQLEFMFPKYPPYHPASYLLLCIEIPLMSVALSILFALKDMSVLSLFIESQKLTEGLAH